VVPERFRLSFGKEGNRVENTGFYDKVIKFIKSCDVIKHIKIISLPLSLCSVFNVS